jgi:Ala-tRNA(Pro) deacylase
MKITNYLQQHGVSFEVMLHHDTYDAQHLAQSVHVPGREVAKTVLLRIDHGPQYAVAVLPAPYHIDIAQAARALGTSQVELATEVEMAKLFPDCEIGALPPFGSNYGMATLVDQSLVQNETITFEGNSHHEVIKMKFSDFQRLEQPTLASFACAP